MKALLKRIKHRADARGYDARHKAEADAAYRAIVAARPAHALSPETEARIRADATERLGSAAFAPWLRVYAAWSGAFREGWIPDNYFGRVVIRQIQSARQKPVSGAKTIAARLLGPEHFPDLAYHVRGCWLDRTGAPIARDSVRARVFEATDRVFAKTDRSSRGRGITSLTADSFSLDAVEAMGDLVLQAAVSQAPVLAEVLPDNLATLRITTTKAAGAAARAVSGFVRFGRRNEATVKAGNEVCVPIAPDGTLAPDGILPDWSPAPVHPDTGVAFIGRTVPVYGAALSLVTGLHDRIPHLAIIGWDVAIDAAGRPRILEWNTGHMEISVPEATVGPCFRDMEWDTLWKAGA